MHDQFSSALWNVQKLIWAKILLFLVSNWASFLSICEDRPDNEWRRFLIGISLNTDKFFIFPSGKSHSPYKFDSLKSYVEDILSPLCIGLKAAYPEKVISSFFRYSKVPADCNMSFSFASV